MDERLNALRRKTQAAYVFTSLQVTPLSRDKGKLDCAASRYPGVSPDA